MEETIRLELVNLEKDVILFSRGDDVMIYSIKNDEILDFEDSEKLRIEVVHEKCSDRSVTTVFVFKINGQDFPILMQPLNKLKLNRVINILESNSRNFLNETKLFSKVNRVLFKNNYEINISSSSTNVWIQEQLSKDVKITLEIKEHPKHKFKYFKKFLLEATVHDKNSREQIIQSTIHNNARKQQESFYKFFNQNVKSKNQSIRGKLLTGKQLQLMKLIVKDLKAGTLITAAVDTNYQKVYPEGDPRNGWIIIGKIRDGSYECKEFTEIDPDNK